MCKPKEDHYPSATLTDSDSAPIHVLHVTNAYPYPAVPEYGVFVKEQIESLDQARIRSSILFINGREDGKSTYLSAVGRVRKAAKNVDVIHCHHVYSALVVALSGYWRRKPVVLSFLNDWTREVKDFPTALGRRLLCSVAVAISSKVIFKSPIPGPLKGCTKAVNLPNGVDTDFFCPADPHESKSLLGLDAKSNYVLFVSSKNKLRDQKRYDLFASTIALAQSMRPDLKIQELVMVGIERSQVPLTFSASSAHLLTSDYEGSPNSVKEALACGTPVVSRDVGNVAQMCADVTGASVVKSANTDVLAAALIKSIEPRLAQESIRQSFLKTGLTRPEVAAKLERIYWDVTTGTAPTESWEATTK